MKLDDLMDLDEEDGGYGAGDRDDYEDGPEDDGDLDGGAGEDDEDGDGGRGTVSVTAFLIPVAVLSVLLLIAMIVVIVVTGRKDRQTAAPEQTVGTADAAQELDAEIEDEIDDEITDVIDAEEPDDEEDGPAGASDGADAAGEDSGADAAGENDSTDVAGETDSTDAAGETGGAGAADGAAADDLTSEAGDGDTASENPEQGTADEGEADAGASMNFTVVEETVTAKDATNLRDIPGQGSNSTVLYTLRNGETAVRTGVSDSGWSRLTYDGRTVYAVSSYLTTDLSYQPPAAEGAESGDGLKTKFADRNEQVTAKIEVNLRALPSVTNPDATVVAVLHNGEYVTRTGINEEVGWSRVDYNGQTLYCISSYLTN